MKDHDNLQAFYLNDESDPDDEFDPSQLDLEAKRFNNTEDENINP